MAEQESAGRAGRQAGLAVLLTGMAAWVDAAGFLLAGDAFVSFMSGNNTELASSVAQGAWPGILLVGSVVLAFLAGVVLGECLSRPAGGWRQPRVYLADALLLCLALAGSLAAWPAGAVLPLLAAAMGVHNASLHPQRGAAVRTYITGTIVQFGRGLALFLMGRGGTAEMRENGTVWAGFVCGALAGGMVALHVGVAAALLVPALFTAGMGIASAVWPRRRG
ncbi:YoaK family protein [Marinibaculum pumilum]|uniref:YoaK family protein n=1 Tax=Marinibaculum pumilum TaxID=1766165 RepID=A0ABV7KV76_9PROT